MNVTALQADARAAIDAARDRGLGVEHISALHRAVDALLYLQGELAAQGLRELAHREAS